MYEVWDRLRPNIDFASRTAYRSWREAARVVAQEPFCAYVLCVVLTHGYWVEFFRGGLLELQVYDPRGGTLVLLSTDPLS